MNVGQDAYDKRYGFSVRCLKNQGDDSQSSNLGQVLNPLGKGSMTDTRDGKTYKTVSLGFQTWMAQNLNYSSSKSYCYKDSSSYCTKYGRLYTWAAAMDSVRTGCGYGKTCSVSGDVKGVCPTGWHLPSVSEWEILTTYVGGASKAGQRLKSISGWNGNGNGKDSFGFSALPAGHNVNVSFFGEGNYAYFWSSTEDYSNDAYHLRLLYDLTGAFMRNGPKGWGYSVRCLKNSN